MALSHNDGKVVMGMLMRGDKNHDIAAWFGENPARVVEVENGTMFGSVPPAAKADDLPPRGAVGPKARRLRAYVADALAALEKGDVDTAVKELTGGLAAFDKHVA